MQLATPGSGVSGSGEAKGACSGAGGDTVSEKGSDFVILVKAGDLGGGGWEGARWEVLLDHDADCWADDRRAGS